MLQIKLKGLNIITFNESLSIKGNISGYTIEHQVLEGKLCETSEAIYPTAQYESEMDKFTAIQTELSCNKNTLVAFDSTEELVEYIDVNGEKFTLKELYQRYKEAAIKLCSCDYTEVKAPQEQMQSIVNCAHEYGCDYCINSCGNYYAFEVDQNKVRLEVFGGAEADMELRIFVAVPELMQQIEEWEKEA